MLIDLLKQAYEAMQYNRRRTIITVAGMAWGIATVVLLLAYGAGFSRAIMAIFEQWGVNSIGVFPGTTSEQAGGKKAGVVVRFTQDDLDRLSASVAGLESLTPRLIRTMLRSRTICTRTAGMWREVIRQLPTS